MIKLSQNQRKVVQHRDGALLVIAGAGSGKTLVLTERVRYLLNNKKGHYRVLALTFTNKAADEMRERLSDVEDIDNRAFIGTMHKFCLEVVNQRGNAIGLQTMPHIFNEDDLVQIIGDVFRSSPKLMAILKSKEKPNQYLHKVYQYISEQKRNLRTPEWFYEQPNFNHETNLFAYVYKQYDDMLHAQNAIDFDDLLILTYKIFTERPKIAEMYRRLYKYICIDEAQDLNFAQYNVLKAICGDEFSNLMMVGDPRQAIYGFNDASSDFMCKEFVRDFAPTLIKLYENFRSSQAIVKVAQALEPTFKMEGTMAVQGEVKAYCCMDEQSEAMWVVKKIEKLHDVGHSDVDDSIAWKRFAILARNRYVTKCVEEELTRKGIPYYIRLTSSVESESEYIKCFELGMRLISNPSDYIHLQQLLRLMKIKKEYIPKDNKNANELLIDICNQAENNSYLSEPWSVYRISLLKAWNLLTDDNPKFIKALDVLELFSRETIADEHQKEIILNDIIMWRAHWKRYLGSSSYGSRTLTQFRQQVALGTTKTHIETDEVALLTVHNSKGLEYDVVFIVGMCDGIFPDYRAVQKRGRELIEEKHNAFVAVTRSKRLLYITYPEYRKMPWGDLKFQSPSRFIKDMSIDIESTEPDER